MQKCRKCIKPFSWGEIYRSFWGWMYKPIKCDKCGTVHHITIIGRLTFVSVTILPMVIFLNFLSPFDNFFSTLGVGIAILILGSLLAPYLLRFKVNDH